MRRFLHGFCWGMLATIAMGVVTLLAITLRVWPLDRPLAVSAAQALLPTTNLLWLYVVGGIGQLIYGGLCGGLLAVAVERVTISSALMLGLLRWFTTQIVVLPLVGWQPFGLAASRWLALATVLPHLAFALALGWLLLHEDDVTGLRGDLRPARLRSRYRRSR